MNKHYEEKRVVSTSSAVVFAIIAGIVGFIGGTRQHELYAFLAPVIGMRTGDTQIDLSSVEDTYRTLSANFDGDLDKSKLIQGATRGMVDAAGDKYTLYMNSEARQNFDKEINGDVGVGIGVELHKNGDLVEVERTLKDNPAEKAGILTGDFILGVNDEDVRSQSVAEIAKKLRGEAGTTVKVVVGRENNETKTFSIVRQTINYPSVWLEYSGDVAVLHIERFDDETASLSQKYAKEIKDKGTSKMILDLRGNGGGYVTAAQAVASLWLNKNDIIVTEKRGEKIEQQIRATGNNLLADIKTVVLTDGDSASASEIVAGALKDHGRATLLGEKTYGKGSVQQVIDLKDGSALKVTVAKWYTPKDKNINGEGISPDKEVKKKTDGEYADRKKDNQIDAAKEELK